MYENDWITPVARDLVSTISDREVRTAYEALLLRPWALTPAQGDLARVRFSIYLLASLALPENLQEAPGGPIDVIHHLLLGVLGEQHDDAECHFRQSIEEQFAEFESEKDDLTTLLIGLVPPGLSDRWATGVREATEKTVAVTQVLIALAVVKPTSDDLIRAYRNWLLVNSLSNGETDGTMPAARLYQYLSEAEG